MGHLVSQLLCVLAAIVLAMLPGFLFMLWFRRQRREKRNPVCRHILRGPGESLRLAMARLDDLLIEQLLLLTFVPVVAVGWILGPTLIQGGKPGQASYLQLAVLLVLVLPVPLLKFIRKIRERADSSLALYTEQAVGRELDQIMRDGFRVFHDLPTGQSHVAHVVVGPSGVFAVESKGHPNPEKGRGAVDAKVIFNGEAIYFPDNVKETEAVARARNQAAVLAQWLTGAVGEPVPVRPVLALPGWYVERKKDDELLFLYGQSHHYARILRGPEVLAENLFKRIVQQLDARCRDAEPKHSGAKDVTD